MKIFSAAIAVILTPIIAAMPVLAQTPLPAANLQLQIVDPGAQGRLSVAVIDALGNRVPDATVVVHLPPGAFFANASEIATVESDASGVARFNGINYGPGGTIRITAAKGSAHAGLLVERAATAVAAPPATTIPSASSQPASAKPAFGLTPQEIAPPAAAKPPQPGVVIVSDDSPYANVPIRASVEEAAGGIAPRMSIVSTKGNGGGDSDHHVRNRVLIGLAIAAAAGGTFFAVHSLHSSSSSSSTGISVGNPTVSVGNP